MANSCQQVIAQLSDYMDGACGPAEARAVRQHVSECGRCCQELEQLQRDQEALRALPRLHVPSEVGLRLRVRISQELHRNLSVRWQVWLDNTVRPLLIPSITGVLTAVFFVSLVLCQGIPPVSTEPDVPMGLGTPARVWQLAPVDFSAGKRPLVVVTYVNANGRATSYRILSGQSSPQILNELDRLVYFSLFRPATRFGRPTNGEVIFSFRQITVRG